MQCLLIRLKSHCVMGASRHPAFMATSQLLVARVSFTYLDEFIFLSLVLLKEMMTLGESKVLFFCLVLIRGTRKWGESNIFFCNLGAGKVLLRTSASGVV